MTPKRLTVQAPRRMSVEGDGSVRPGLGVFEVGKFYTLPWTLEEVLRYKAGAGGYFNTSGHDFDCKETALEATR